MTEINLAVAIVTHEPVQSAQNGADPNSPWRIPGVIDRLKELHAEGISAGQICATLNYEFRAQLPRPISRNAVIGKLHRMGLVVGSGKAGGSRSRKMSGQAANGLEAKLKRKSRRVQRTYKQCGGRKIALIDVFEPDPTTNDNGTAFDLQIPQEQRRTIRQLESHHCCWPIGDPAAPDFFYCGAVKIEGLSYCAHHCGVAYRATPRISPQFDPTKWEGRRPSKNSRILMDWAP